MDKKKKKGDVELKYLTIQKICLVLEIIMVVLILICGIYGSRNEVNNGFVEFINTYGLFVVLALLLFPYFFKEDK